MSVSNHFLYPITQHSVWAIIPVKPLPDSKCRLAHILSAAERAELIHRFLTRTLTVLNQSGVIDRILVVSRDDRALAAARLHGAEALMETAVTGLNPAVTQAVNHAAKNGSTAVLILPVDLPFIQSEDVGIMVKGGRNGRRQSGQIIICSDNKNQGTNALLISPPRPFTFHYGEGSFQQHLQEAKRRHLTAHIVQIPGLQFDLDTEEDWHKFMACEVGSD